MHNEQTKVEKSSRGPAAAYIQAFGWSDH